MNLGRIKFENKPENPFQTMTSLRIGKIYIMSKEISQYDYQKYKNRKPDNNRTRTNWKNLEVN